MAVSIDELKGTSTIQFDFFLIALQYFPQKAKVAKNQLEESRNDHRCYLKQADMQWQLIFLELISTDYGIAI